VFRPQFPMPCPPEGFEYQPCVFQYDQTNTPGFAQVQSLASGQATGYIPLTLDNDAPFILLGIKIVNAGVEVQVWDPYTNPLLDDFLQPPEFASDVPQFCVLERGIECPAGSNLTVRFEGE